MVTTGIRPTDNVDQRARLVWQCRRGMLELDWLLLGFLEQTYDSLEAGERQALETLLGYPDPVLLEWLMGRMIPFDKDIARLVEKIRNTPAP